MGLLFLGTALNWEEARKYADHIRLHGITQFLNIWEREKDRHGDGVLWGDEVEYMLVSFDDEGKNAKLALKQTEVLDTIESIQHKSGSERHVFVVECGGYMVESTPAGPYTGSMTDLLRVERSMRERRKLIRGTMGPNDLPLTVTAFPRIGVPGVFTEPHFRPEDATSTHSLFLPDEATSPHVRFPACVANIPARRGSKIQVNIPIYIDDRTPRPFVDPTIPWHRDLHPDDSEARNGAAFIDHIYLDSLQFGMGCCCLQVTFQANNLSEARRLYDGLIPLTGVIMSLTAASPAWRGWLADVDARWSAVAACLDDRTEEERGLKPLKDSRFRIPKSRYDSVDSYLSLDPMNRPEYNDNEMPYDEDIYARLRENGVDDLMAKHVSHLFIRDPIVVYKETLDQDENSTGHWENLQSSNWQTMRFKPPPPGSGIGWRVEFRSMEVQITDFENAAFAVFMVLLSRVILKFDLNFYIPMSKVDENMRRSQQRDAVHTQKFYFRKEIGHPSPPASNASSSSGASTPSASPPLKDTPLQDEFILKERIINVGPVEDEYEEMTIQEIFNGKPDHFPGLLSLVDAYVEGLDEGHEKKREINRYLDFIKRRVNGSLVTPATWIRNFIRSHPAYKFDSAVSQEINYDLMVAIEQIERGVRSAPDLLPEDYATARD
ncbi:hypothetical protein PLICRDRAFT_509474 [Plicaturopsis crispa FD-325 SS-3]|nr:hypothetical protein PLICRDRAFT_509474 [Plicaturopsis crispa FD-325 SS-3]